MATIVYGVTPAGFIRRPFEVILKSLEDLYRDNVDPEADVSVSSPIGVFLQGNANELAIAWDGLENVYFSNQAESAEGVQLDRIVGLIGLLRKPSQQALVVLELTGTPGVTIPAGTAVQTATVIGEIIFLTLNDALIGGGGTVDSFSRADIANIGTEGNVAAGSLTRIVNPVSGLASVTNPLAASGGLAIETDAELRDRFFEARTISGSSIPAIAKAVLEIPAVTSVGVLENVMDFVDADGVPSHSFEVIAVGGQDQDIAQVIFDTKPGGIRPFGSVTIPVTDIKSQVHSISFSRQVAVDVFIQIAITKNALFDDASIPAIKTNTVKLIGGTDLQPATAVTYVGSDPGVDVNPFQVKSIHFGDLSGRFENIPGISSAAVLLGFTSPPLSSDILTITPRQQAVTDTDKITVITI